MSGEDCVDVEVIHKLEQMVGADVVREIVELFLRHAPRKLARAREAAGQGDLDSIARELHSLKSSAGSIGALDLQRLAETLEKLAVGGRGESMRERLDELAAEYDRVEERLGELSAERSE